MMSLESERAPNKQHDELRAGREAINALNDAGNEGHRAPEEALDAQAKQFEPNDPRHSLFDDLIAVNQPPRPDNVVPFPDKTPDSNK